MHPKHRRSKVESHVFKWQGGLWNRPQTRGLNRTWRRDYFWIWPTSALYLPLSASMESASDSRFDPNYAMQLLLDIAQEQSVESLLNKLVTRGVEQPSEIRAAQRDRVRSSLAH